MDTNLHPMASKMRHVTTHKKNPTTVLALGLCSLVATVLPALLRSAHSLKLTLTSRLSGPETFGNPRMTGFNLMYGSYALQPIGPGTACQACAHGVPKYAQSVPSFGSRAILLAFRICFPIFSTTPLPTCAYWALRTFTTSFPSITDELWTSVGPDFSAQKRLPKNCMNRDYACPDSQRTVWIAAKYPAVETQKYCGMWLCIPCPVRTTPK